MLAAILMPQPIKAPKPKGGTNCLQNPQTAYAKISIFLHCRYHDIHHIFSIKIKAILLFRH
jgi:hypothetical protein